MLVTNTYWWRDLDPSEYLPAEYRFFDGSMWVHRYSTGLTKERMCDLPGLSIVRVPMTAEKIAAYPLSLDIDWYEMTTDDRYIYNKPAFEAYEKAAPVVMLTAYGWTPPSVRQPNLQYPFKPYVPPEAKRWYLTKYPDGSTIGYETLEAAEYAAVGQDVEIITVIEENANA